MWETFLDIYCSPLTWKVLGCFECVLIYRAWHYWRRAKRMKDTPTSKIGDITDGYREIKGRVVAIDRSKMLKAPMSEKRCVYYEIDVREGCENGEIDHVSDVEAVPWGVDDGTGVATIYPEGAEVVLALDADLPTPSIELTSAKQEAILAKYNVSKRNIFLQERRLGFHESTVKEGDQLYVLGPAKVIDGRVCFKTSTERRLLISARSEGAMLAQEKSKVLGSTVGALLLPIAGIVALIIHSNR